MSVNRSGYYKWKHRQKNPGNRALQRESDLNLVKEVHDKHPSHGYRWINAFIFNKYGVKYTDSYVHRLCKYEGIRSQGKHYQWKRPQAENYKFNNLVWNGWSYLSRPYEVIVSDMTSFYVKRQIYELTLYFDAWSKEIVGYGLGMHKGDKQSYYDGLKQVLEKIKEQPDNLITRLCQEKCVSNFKGWV